MNLFSDLPSHAAEELVTTLTSSSTVRIERIVSTGQTSPEDFWYDQSESEWVVVLKGAARLSYDNDESIDLHPGDHVLIPAGRKHRVDWTSDDEPTVWLAVFFAK